MTDFLLENIHHAIMNTQALHCHGQEQCQVEIVHGDECEPTRQCARDLMDGCQQEHVPAEQVDGEDQQNGEAIMMLLAPLSHREELLSATKHHGNSTYIIHSRFGSWGCRVPHSLSEKHHLGS